jgi:hypothetical protein
MVGKSNCVEKLAINAFHFVTWRPNRHPLLNHLDITFFDQLIFDTSQPHDFRYERLG